MIRSLFIVAVAVSSVSGVVDAFATNQHRAFVTKTTKTTTTTRRQNHRHHDYRPIPRGVALSSSSSSDFDFPSAMPAKPELTLEEKMAESADNFIETMKNALKANDVPNPPELDALIKVREDPSSDVSDITLCVYQLMIERGMLYDEDPETGSLTPTTFDDIPGNLDIPEVKQEFLHLYKYGMMLMDKGLLNGEQVKETVVERLVKRTGLTPEKFDEWLGF